MALVKTGDTLSSPTLNTNVGKEVKKQREDQKATSDVNKALKESGQSFDPTKQAVNKAGYEKALTEYNNWVKTRGNLIAKASSITLNKDTGDITVNAPQKVLDSPLVKQNYEEALKAISQAYKINHDYKFALMENSDETKTAEEWVEEINKNFKEDAARYYNREEAKDEIEAGVGIRLSDEQLTKRSTVAIDYNDENGQTVTVKDDTMQAIPASAMDLKIFRKVRENWDEDAHVIKWGDLKKIWNRDNVSDQEILDVYKFVDEYFSKGDFSDPDELAEMMALNTFITRKDPSVNFWRGSAEVMGEAIGSVITGAATFDVNVMSSLETFGNWVANMFQAGSDIIAGVDPDTAWKEATGNDTTFVRDYVAPTLQDFISKHHEAVSRLNDVAAGVNIAANTLVPLGMQIAVSVAAGNAAADMMKTSVGRIITSSAEKVGADISSLSTTFMSNVAAGTITAKEIVTSLYFGTDIMLKLSTPQAAMAAVMNSINLLKAASIATSTVVKIADIAAQAVVDITLSDPKLFRQLMESPDNDAKAYALEQLTQNTIGEVVSVGAGRIIKNFASSDVGKVLNAKWGTRINGLRASMGEATDKLKIALFHGGNENWLVEKAARLSEEAKEASGTWLSRIANNRASKAERQLRAYASNVVSREAAKKVAGLAGNIKGDTWDEILEAAKKTQNEMRKVISDANTAVIDILYKTDVSADVAKMISDYPKLELTRNRYLESLTALLKAEDAAGLGANAKVIELVDGSKLRLLDKETNEYVNALYRTREAQAVIKLSDNAEDIAGAKKELEHYAAKMKEFAEKNPEVAAAAQKLEKSARKFEFEVQNVRVSLGVLPQETLDAMRFSGYFDAGYMRQQRIQDWANYKKRGGQLHISELRGAQNYKWGSFGEWQDTTLVVFDDLEEVARQVRRKKSLETLKGLGIPVKTVVGEDGVRMVEEVNPVRKKAIKNLTHNTDVYVKNMDGSFFDSLFDYNLKKAATGIAEDEAIAAGARLKKSESILPNVTRKERISYLQDLPEEMLDEVIWIDQANPFTIDIDEVGGWDEFQEALGDKTKAWLFEQMDNEVGGILQAPTTPYKEAVNNLASIPDSEKFSLESWYQFWNENSYNANMPDWMKNYIRSAKSAANTRELPSWARYFVTTGEGGKDLTDLTQIDEMRKQWEEVKRLRKMPGATRTPSLYTAENFKKLINNNPELFTKLKKYYALNNSKVFDSDTVKQAAALVKQQKEVFENQMLYYDKLSKLNSMREKWDLPKIEGRIDRQVDELIETAIDNNAKDANIQKAFGALGDAAAGEDDIIEYATLRSLEAHKRKLGNEFYARAKKEFNEAMTAKINAKYAITDDMTAAQKKAIRAAKKKASAAIEKTSNEYAKQATELFKDKITDRFNEVTGRLAAQGSDIIDTKNYFARVDTLNKQITEAASSPNIVKTYGAHGYEEYVELSPTIASMYTTMPRPLQVGPFGEVQRAFVRAFRFGTTGGFVPGSLVNQAFRDVGNALVAGDAWKTNRAVEKILAENFGDEIAESLQRELPDLWESLLAKSEETGTPVNELIAKRELARGAMNVDAELESNIYQFGREARAKRSAEGLYNRNTLDKMTDSLDKFQKKADTLNNIRETYLRNRVYNNNLLKALEDGMSLQDARSFASFMQAEATTNFSRQTYHLANLSQTVPYLGSAINGAKSFWRLYTLDPVGVTTRIVGGYVVPVIALTVMSLGDEENARIYKQIPEYEKSEHLTFVVEGQIYSIPVPQEISIFTNAAQHMVEAINGANDNSFSELMANDLLGAFPIDLSGFVNIDADKILGDNLVSNHLIPGFVKASSQMMAPLVKSGFMLATGIDPYTMKPINTGYKNVDPETGELTVMDSSTGELAKTIASVTGDFISPQMAQKVLTNLFGNGSMMIIDSLGDIANAVSDEDTPFIEGISDAFQRIAENGLSKLYVDRKGEESNLAWNRAVAQLYREKEALLHDKDYQTDLQSLSNKELSDKARKEVESRLSTRKQEYLQKVLDAANNLVNEYGGTLDRYKFASVLSLMNLELDSINENPYNAYATYLSKQEYNVNKAIAVETMAKMGFKGPTDDSIFGYYTEDSDGNVGIKYNSPLAILNYSTSETMQDKIAFASIRDILIEEKLYDRHEAISKQLKAIYDKKKLTNSDYNQIDAIKINWNAEVFAAIAPYVSQMTPEAAINNKQVRDLLYPYIEVPGSWEKNNKNRSVSLGDRGNKKAAYYESWLKSMFKVNDPYKGQY